jgi:hypothetical protein
MLLNKLILMAHGVLDSIFISISRSRNFYELQFPCGTVKVTSFGRDTRRTASANERYTRRESLIRHKLQLEPLSYRTGACGATESNLMVREGERNGLTETFG